MIYLLFMLASFSFAQSFESHLALGPFSQVAMAQAPAPTQTAPSDIIDGILTPEKDFGLYGHTSIAVYSMRVCNYTGTPVGLATEQIYIAAAALPVVSRIDAVAALTMSFYGKPVNKTVRFITLVAGIAGFSSGGGLGFNISAQGLRWLIGGVTVAHEYIEPMLIANQPTLANLLANTLDDHPVLLGVTPSDFCATRTVFAARSPKPQTIRFQFVPGALPGPQPEPIPAPMMRRIQPRLLGR